MVMHTNGITMVYPSCRDTGGIMVTIPIGYYPLYGGIL